MVAKKYTTKEEADKARRERDNRRNKKRRAEQAVASGRVSGLRGAPIRYADDEHARGRAKVARWKERNREELRRRDRDKKRSDRRAKALAEGREPSRVGRVRELSDAERRNHATENMRRWREANPEKAAALEHKTYLRNKAKVVERSRLRRLAKIATGSHNSQDILDLWEAQKRKCVFCLKGIQWGKFEIDHHVPLSRGGSNGRENLRLLHPRCNRSKGARTPEDHAQRNGLLCW